MGYFRLVYQLRILYVVIFSQFLVKLFAPPSLLRQGALPHLPPLVTPK